MLPRSHRLPSSVRLTKAQTVTSPYFLLKYVDNAEKKTRLSVIISKKVEKTAVGRNRLRRLFQTIFQKHLPTLRPGVDMLHIALPLSREVTKDVLEKELISVWQKKNLVS